MQSKKHQQSTIMAYHSFFMTSIGTRLLNKGKITCRQFAKLNGRNQPFYCDLYTEKPVL